MNCFVKLRLLITVNPGGGASRPVPCATRSVVPYRLLHAESVDARIPYDASSVAKRLSRLLAFLVSTLRLLYVRHARAFSVKLLDALQVNATTSAAHIVGYGRHG